MCSSGKVLYRTRAVAKRAAKTIKGIGKGCRLGTYTNVLRPYLCLKCGMYHLTSQEKHGKG